MACVNYPDEQEFDLLYALIDLFLGSATEELDWTARDGTILHTAYEDAVDDELGDPDNGVYVYNNYEVTIEKEDGSLTNGVIDTLIEHGDKATIVDYKTNDMSDWTISEAIHQAHEHGQQVKEYVDSPDTPSNAEGLIIAAGRSSLSSDAQQAYIDTLASYDVEVKFTEGGTPEDIVDAVEAAMSDSE